MTNYKVIKRTMGNFYGSEYFGKFVYNVIGVFSSLDEAFEKVYEIEYTPPEWDKNYDPYTVVLELNKTIHKQQNSWLIKRQGESYDWLIQSVKDTDFMHGLTDDEKEIVRNFVAHPPQVESTGVIVPDTVTIPKELENEVRNAATKYTKQSGV